MIRRHVLSLLLLSFACSRGLAAADGTPPCPPTLDQLIAQGVQNSPELLSLNYQVRAAEAMIRPAGALPDPMLEVGLKDLPVGAGISLNQDTMSGLEFMASQEVPRSAKRRLNRGVQADMARMLREKYADKRNDIVRRVTKAYREVQAMDEQIRITKRNQQLAEDMLAVAEANYATGKVMQQDVFMAQVRLSQMVDMLLAMRKERANAEVMLGEALTCLTGFTIGPLPPPERTPVALDAEALVAAADAASPPLLEMRVRVEQAEKQVRLAALGLKPDYTFSLAYMIRETVDMDPMSGTDMWSAAVGINLPWVYRRDKADQQRKSAAATKCAALEDVAARRNELASMVRQRANDIHSADQQLSLLETGLLPQSEGAVAAARSAYVVGKGSITAMLDSQMSFLSFQLQRFRITAEREIALAELTYLIGKPGCPPAEGVANGG